MNSLDDIISIYDDGDYETAFSLFYQRAQEKDIGAQMWLADMYFRGKGVDKNISESIRWLRRAAESGDLVAQNNLVIALLSHDPEEALSMLLSTAESGATPCQSLLGDIYSGAISVLPQHLRNLSLAIEWYERAGEGGFSYAYHRLGEIYSREDEYRDIKKAIFFFRGASEEGYTDSEVNLDRLTQEE